MSLAMGWWVYPEIPRIARSKSCGRAQEARAALANLLASGPLVLRDVGRDKYNGRVVASVEIGNPSARDQSNRENVATLMIAGGYGRPYDGRARATCVS